MVATGADERSYAEAVALTKHQQASGHSQFKGPVCAASHAT